MTERVWSWGRDWERQGRGITVLCKNGEVMMEIDWYDERVLLAIVDALNEKEAREAKTTVGAALRELLPDATILKIDPIDT